MDPGEALAATATAIATALGTAITMSARTRRKAITLDGQAQADARAAEQSDREAWRAMWRGEIDRLAGALQSVSTQRDEYHAELVALRATLAQIVTEVDALRAEVAVLRERQARADAKTPTDLRPTRAATADEWRSRAQRDEGGD